MMKKIFGMFLAIMTIIISLSLPSHAQAASQLLDSDGDPVKRGTSYKIKVITTNHAGTYLYTHWNPDYDWVDLIVAQSAEDYYYVGSPDSSGDSYTDTKYYMGQSDHRYMVWYGADLFHPRGGVYMGSQSDADTFSFTLSSRTMYKMNCSYGSVYARLASTMSLITVNLEGAHTFLVQFVK